MYAAAKTNNVALWEWGVAEAGFSLEVDLPILEINAEKMPNITENIENAQANGAPDTLTRTTDQQIIDTNRQAAKGHFQGEASPGEYPFASTYEGVKAFL
jgi:hypothetical protein